MCFNSDKKVRSVKLPLPLHKGEREENLSRKDLKDVKNTI